MDALTMAPTYRVLLGAVRRVRLLVVGVGGTGSTLALFLAGLAFHARGKGIQVELTLVDDDMVEMKNCGRQAASVQAAMAGGVPKVADLALRLNAAYGLGITAWPARYEAGMVRDWFDYDHHTHHLIIGCVDNHRGRQEIAHTLAATNGRIWAIDCGNEQVSGQILIGNLTDMSRIELDRLGLCTGLPSPYLQEPNLLLPDPTPQTPSCAQMEEAQSLMVNRMAATITAQYVTAFVLQGQVCYLSSVFNLTPPAVKSQQITATSLNPYITKEVASGKNNKAAAKTP